MVNISSKISRSGKAIAERYSKLGAGKKVAVQCVVAALVVALPQAALAQTSMPNTGAGFFCYIAQYFKQIVGTAALVAIFMWALEHIFGVSKLHDIVIKVGIACAIVIGAAAIITNSGLTVSCAATF